jgi:hypothetical protein
MKNTLATLACCTCACAEMAALPAEPHLPSWWQRIHSRTGRMGAWANTACVTSQYIDALNQSGKQPLRWQQGALNANYLLTIDTTDTQLSAFRQGVLGSQHWQERWQEHWHSEQPAT